MEIFGIGILSWITFLPVLGMILVLMLPKDRKDVIRWTSLGVAALQLVLAVLIFMRFDRGLAGINTESGMQFLDSPPLREQRHRQIKLIYSTDDEFRGKYI